MRLGVFPGVSYEEYARWEGLRSSYLREFKRTPRHAHLKALYPPEPSAAFELGNAAHTAILEPELLEQRYALAPKIDRRFNEGKAAFAKFQAEHGHKQVLEEKHWLPALGARDAIWQEPWAAELLQGAGFTELSVRWIDAESGLPCKARIDRYCNSFRGHTTVCDLKTTRDAGKESFKADVERFSYGMQAAFYLDGLEAAAGPHVRQWFWIAIEKTPPYAAALYIADEDVLAEGRRLYREAIRAHAQCTRSGFWPGYSPEPQLLNRPRWAASRALMEEPGL